MGNFGDFPGCAMPAATGQRTNIEVYYILTALLSLLRFSQPPGPDAWPGRRKSLSCNAFSPSAAVCPSGQCEQVTALLHTKLNYSGIALSSLVFLPSSVNSVSAAVVPAMYPAVLIE